MRQVLVAVLAILFLGAVAANAQDCSGPEPSACPLLPSAKAIFVGRVTENEKNSETVRFRVTEQFKGVRGDFVDLAKGIDHFDFQVGKDYLVFAVPCIWQGADKKCLMKQICTGTRPAENAAAVLQQLRAEKNGKQVAAVYGTLVRALGDGQWDWREGYPRPLPNILVRLKSDKKSFETRTDAQGAYAFSRLPPGKYQVSADLPFGLELGNLIGDNPPDPFELPHRCCFENNLYALPSGRITGRVIGPDGNPLRFVSVDLYPFSRYERGEKGIYSLQGRGSPGGEWKPFDFYHLPANDYVLVMNPKNEENPDAPFPTTFYPHANNIEAAAVIHLADGQNLSGADIHVDSPLPTRQVAIRLLWGDRRPQDFYSPQVIVKTDRGTIPYPHPTSQSVYAINVLLNARYTIHAEALCKMGTKGKLRTDDVIIDGSDLSVSEVQISFGGGGCVHQ